MAYTPCHADSQELLPQTHTWTATATQMSPDRATLILLVLCIYTCRLQAQAWLPARDTVTEPRPPNPMAQLSLLAFSSTLRHSRNKKMQKCITYEVSWVSFLLLKKKIFRINIF